MSNKGAHQITETRTGALVASQQSGDLLPSNSSKAERRTNQLEQAVEDNGRTFRCPEEGQKHSFECSNTKQGLAIEQAQNFLLPDIMGEKRRACDTVINKINNVAMTPSSPEALVAISSLPIPPAASVPQAVVPCFTPDEPMSTPMAKQQGLDIVVSKDEETNTEKLLPEAKVAPTLPIHSPALHQLLDKALQCIGIAQRQSDLYIVNTQPMSSDVRSLKIETARKQSEVIKNHSLEGKGIYLSHATAYIRERMNRHTSACNAFIPRAQREPPDKDGRPCQYEYSEHKNVLTLCHSGPRTAHAQI